MSGNVAEAPPRFAEERQQRIAQTLRELGRVEVSALAAAHGVSTDTVRRDLHALAARGLAQKTHGGAVALHVAVLPARQRSAVANAAKNALAAAAARLVRDNDTLFIDSGTTTQALVALLVRRGAPRPLTVVTHALDVAVAFSDDARVELVLAGGRWLPSLRVFAGESALAALRSRRADIAFLGACALHPRAGLTAHEAQEAPVKRAMIDGAARRVVLADSTKLNAVAACAVARLDELDCVISDAAPGWLRAAVKVERVRADHPARKGRTAAAPVAEAARTGARVP